MKKLLVKSIEIYQCTLSPDHGWLKRFFPAGYCKFEPTCSEYTKLAIIKFGPLKGLTLGFWRILRCNPWSRGGADHI